MHELLAGCAKLHQVYLQSVCHDLERRHIRIACQARLGQVQRDLPILKAIDILQYSWIDQLNQAGTHLLSVPEAKAVDSVTPGTWWIPN